MVVLEYKVNYISVCMGDSVLCMCFGLNIRFAYIQESLSTHTHIYVYWFQYDGRAIILERDDRRAGFAHDERLRRERERRGGCSSQFLPTRTTVARVVFEASQPS